jgi:protein-tyrosine kinase
VRTTSDTEALVELPVAGIIPRALPRAASTPLPQLTALMPVSPEGEAYRFLSLHLLLSRDDNPVRVLMMATAKPGQGATTTLSNLAATLAQGNRRVILVDADLRRPALHKVFETSNEVGLTSVLAEGLPVERALQSTAVPNLALLTAGPANDNPWSLLRSTAMEGLVRRLRSMADFVLIDTPSAAAFADAFNVAPLVDGAFMVVRSCHTPTGIEMKIKEMFEQAGVKVFGAILNDVPLNNVDSCRYHTQYYSKKRALADGATPALPAARS